MTTPAGILDYAPPAGGHPGDWRLHDADLVRAAAAVLIANSHLEEFYAPHAWLAGDGLSGNALFYFLSGFGVALATQSRGRGFGPWFGRRAARLYPAAVLASLLVQVVFLGQWRQWSALDVLRTFIYPTTYGYVGHIMLVYAGLFWLLRPRSRWPLVIVIAGMMAWSVGAYVAFLRHMPAGAPLALGQTGWWLHWCYFTALVLAGALFGPATRRPRGTLLRDAVVLGGLFAVYVGLKFEMVHGRWSRAFYGLHMLVAVMCLLAVRVSADDRLQAWVRRVRPVHWAVSLLAAATLEMYIVQTWTHLWPDLIRLRFPLNLVAFWVVTVAGGVVLRVITRAVMRAIYGVVPASRARAATG